MPRLGHNSRVYEYVYVYVNVYVNININFYETLRQTQTLGPCEWVLETAICRATCIAPTGTLTQMSTQAATVYRLERLVTPSLQKQGAQVPHPQTKIRS